MKKNRSVFKVSRYPESMLKKPRHLKCYLGSLILRLEEFRFEQFEFKT